MFFVKPLRTCCLGLAFLVSQPVLAEDIKVYVDDVEFAPFETPYVKLLDVKRLSSLDDRFGGLSALLKVEDGFVSLSDRGHLFHFPDDDFKTVSVDPLREKNDDPLEGKNRSDAESLAAGPDGAIYVSFERDHRVVRYNRAGYVISKDIKFSKDLSLLSKNGGLEAIESLSDGRLILIGEGKKDADTAPVWRQGKNKWQRLSLKKLDGFRPTGLARIPGTDRLILLERFYTPLSGVRARLSEIDIHANRIALIAELGPPSPVDNFEGIAIDRLDNGQVRVTLISDDNFSILQRTLVMHLILK